MKKQSKLYGLILSGGKSTRMGTDKGMLNYHGMPQKEYLYKMLQDLCDEVYLSIREDQQVENTEFNSIIDQNKYRGPFNGILSAYEAHPEAAWLVLACDLPLLNKAALQQLIKERNEEKVATSFATTESNLPEPLITIWEPEALEKAKIQMQTSESSCPRKFLINSDIQLLHPEKDEVLFNANTLEEYEFAKNKSLHR